MKRSLLIALAAGAALVLPATGALAHVTVNPREAAGGGYAKLAFRVPNERSDAATTKLEVNLPADHPFASVSVRPQPGWTYTVEKAKLATPIRSHDSELTEAVSKITWTGGQIKAGEFNEFEVSVGPLLAPGRLVLPRSALAAAPSGVPGAHPEPLGRRFHFLPC